MRREIDYKGIKVVYTDDGSGQTLLFLHGYLETGEIWSPFSEMFLPGFRIIVPDIPGHGESGVWDKEHSMDDCADAIRVILDEENIDKATIIGHSMGGYVAMAFTDLFGERLKRLCLFHSSPFADSEEKRLNREREISLIMCGKKQQIISVNIPKGFSSQNIERLNKQVEKARVIAGSCSNDGTISLLNGMKGRPDRSHTLTNIENPVLIVGGKEDNYISEEVYNRIAAINPGAQFSWLENSGHMGFVEEPEKAYEVIIEWLEG